MALANSVALAPGVLFAPVAAAANGVADAALDAGDPAVAAALSAGNSPARRLQPVLPKASRPTSAQGEALPADAVASEIQLLKSEMAGVQCVLAYLKGADEISNLGKKMPKQATQEQLRRRAEAVTRSLHDAPLRQAGVLPALQHSASSPGAHGKAAAGAAAQAGLCGGGAHPSSPGHTTLSAVAGGGKALPPRPQLSSAVAAAASEAGAAAPSNASLCGFGPVDSRGAPASWRRPRPVVPVGRGEAIILEAALDEALPAGAIAAKYAGAAEHAAAVMEGVAQRARAGGEGPEEGGDGGWAQAPSAAQVLLDSQDVRADWELLQSVHSEAARQVAAGCAERGRLLIKVRCVRGGARWVRRLHHGPWVLRLARLSHAVCALPRRSATATARCLTRWRPWSRRCTRPTQRWWAC